MKMQRGFYSVRSSRMWNSLPHAVVLDGSVDTIKKGLIHALTDKTCRTMHTVNLKIQHTHTSVGLERSISFSNHTVLLNVV